MAYGDWQKAVEHYERSHLLLLAEKHLVGLSYEVMDPYTGDIEQVDIIDMVRRHLGGEEA